ncbi:MAG: D-alanyl-D-alanine carboxypeptidase [Clostridiales bacterium]|nr:D-alanyl-D-alanine carboxypeptidase [Clostridiales bacterium]
MKKFNIFTVFLISVILAVSTASPAVWAHSEPDIAAEAVLLVETKSGKILLERNKDIRVAPGSLAKVMALLLAVLEIENEQASLNEYVTASETFLNGIDDDAATQEIKPGESLSYKDLMYCTYIASANDACNILAERIGGSTEEFVNMMNDKAGELGCTNTHFVNPGGLNDPRQYTSAWDQYIIFKEAVSHPLFLEITGTGSYKTEASDDSTARSFNNPNQMLWEKSEYYYEYSVAGKTASSNEYGNSMVSFSRNEEMSLISVVFGVKPDKGEGKSGAAKCFSETVRLFDWAFTGFMWHDIFKQHEIITNEKIALSKDMVSIDIMTSEAITILARYDLTAEDIKKDVVIYGKDEGKVISAPVKKGDILGEVTVLIDGAVCGKVRLVAADSVKLDKGAFIKSEIAGTLSLLWVKLIIIFMLVFIGLYIWLVVRDRKKRLEKKRRIEETRQRLIESRQKRTKENSKISR